MSKKEYRTRNTDFRFQIFQPLQKSEIVNLFLNQKKFSLWMHTNYDNLEEIKDA